MSKQQAKRHSILKKRPSVAAMASEESSPVTGAVTVAPTDVIKGPKKIGFNRKKSIREFLTNEETGTLWMNSYEVSTDGTPSSNVMSDTLLGTTLPEDKENRAEKSTTDDAAKRPSPNVSAWDLSIMAGEDERRRMKTPETLQNFSILNNTERLYSEPNGPVRSILKQLPVGYPQVGPVPVPDVEAMDISPVKPLSSVRIQSPRKTRYYHPQQNMFVTIDDVVRTEPGQNSGNAEQWRKKSSVGFPGVDLSAEAWNSHPATALRLGMSKRDSVSDVDTTLAISQSVAKLLAAGSLAQLNSLENTKLTVEDVTGMWDESTTDVKIPLNALARSRPSFVPSEGPSLSIVKQEPDLNVSAFQRKPSFGGVSFGDLTLALGDSAKQMLIKPELQSTVKQEEDDEQEVAQKAGAYYRRQSSNVLSDFIFGVDCLELKIPETPVVKPKVLLPPKRCEEQRVVAIRKTLLLDNDPMEQDVAKSRPTVYDPAKMDESKLLTVPPVMKERQTTYTAEAIGAKPPQRPTLYNDEAMTEGSPNPKNMLRKTFHREEYMRLCAEEEEVTKAEIHRQTVHRADEIEQTPPKALTKVRPSSYHSEEMMEQTHLDMECKVQLDDTQHCMEDMNETNRRFAESPRSTNFGQLMMEQSLWCPGEQQPEPALHSRKVTINGRPSLEELPEFPIDEAPCDGNQTLLQPTAMEEITVGIQCHTASQPKTRQTTYDLESIAGVSEAPTSGTAAGRQTLYRLESMEETALLARDQGLVEQTAVQDTHRQDDNSQAQGASAMQQTFAKSRSTSHVVENMEETILNEVVSQQHVSSNSREKRESTDAQQIVDGDASEGCYRESTEEVRFMSSLKHLRDSRCRASLYKVDDVGKSSSGSLELHGETDSRASKSRTTVYDLDAMEVTTSPRLASDQCSKGVKLSNLEAHRFAAMDQPLLQQFHNRKTVYYQDPMEETTITLQYLKGGAIKGPATGQHPEVIEQTRDKVEAATNRTRVTTFKAEDMNETALVDQTSQTVEQTVPPEEMEVQRKPRAMQDASTSYSIPVEMQRTTGVVTSPGQIFRLPAAQAQIDAEEDSQSSTRPNYGSLTMHTLTDELDQDGSMVAFLAAERSAMKSSRITTFQQEAMDETATLTPAYESSQRHESLPTAKARTTIYNQSAVMEESMAAKLDITGIVPNSPETVSVESADAPTSNTVHQVACPPKPDHRTANVTEMLELTNSEVHEVTDGAVKPRRTVHFGLVTENVYSQDSVECTELSVHLDDSMPEKQQPMARSRDTILVPQDMEESTVANVVHHIKQEGDHSFAAPMLQAELADDQVMRGAGIAAPLHFSFVNQSISVAPAEFSKDFKSTTLRTVNGTVPTAESMADELNEFSTVTETPLLQPMDHHMVHGPDISTGFREITEPPMKPLQSVPVSVIRETPIKEERVEDNEGSGGEEEFFDAAENVDDVPAVCQTMKFVDVEQMEQTNVHRQTMQGSKSILQGCDPIAPDVCQTMKFVDIDQLEQTQSALSITIKRQISQISKSLLYGDDPLNVSLPESLPLKKRKTLDQIAEEDDATATQQRIEYAAAIETITVKQEQLSIADDSSPGDDRRKTLVKDTTIFVTEGDDMLADESNPSLFDHSPDARRIVHSEAYSKNYQEIVNITDDTCMSLDNSCIVVSDDSMGDLQLNTSDQPQLATELSDLPVRLQKTRHSLVLESTIASEVMDEIMQKFPQTKHPCCGFQGMCVCASRRALEIRQREIQIVRSRWQNAIGRFRDRVKGVPVTKLTFEEQIEELTSKRRMNDTRCKDGKLTLAAPYPETPSLRMLCDNLISYLTEVANEAEKPLACHLPATPSVCLLVRNRLRSDGSRWQLDNSEACFGRLALRHRTLRSVVIDIRLQKPLGQDNIQQRDVRLESIQLVESSESFVNSPKLFLAHREFMAAASETSMRVVRANYRTTGALMGLVNHFDTILGQVFELVNRLLVILRNNNALLYVGQDRFYVKRVFYKKSTLMTNVLYVQFDRIQDISDAGLRFKVPFPDSARILASAERTTGTTSTARALMFLESMLWHLQEYIES